MTTQVTRDRSRVMRAVFLSGVSTLALCAFAAPCFAQDATAASAADNQVVVVTGIRGSLQKSMNLKRKASGVVDSINAEDIGKYPDTNLAESVQRIPGVSISRVNGEGAKVTVRGFGAEYNLVTLNGRTMPTASVGAVGGDQSGDFATGNDRSFDFSQIASDGINGFDVYKTGRASIPSGGIGATLNVRTIRPLDGKPGSTGSLTVKALSDAGVQDRSTTTPEISGVYNWVNSDKTVGISLFGSHREANTATRELTVNAWNRDTGAQFLNPANGRVTVGTTITNSPAATDYVMFPNDSRTDYAETHHVRDNASGVVQFRPSDSLTLTVDALYIDDRAAEDRSDQANWFNRPFNVVNFDGAKPNSTSVFLQENIAGTKDMGFEQQRRAVENKLTDFGVNAKWKATDRLTLSFDAHQAKASALPDNPNGTSSTTLSMAAKVIAAHSLDFRSGVPVQDYTFNDAIAGNNNGVLDLGDLGTQVGRTFTASQVDTMNEVRFDGTYAVDDSSHLDFGVGWRSSKMTEQDQSTYDALGDWGVGNPGDVLHYAPGLTHAYCLSCLFKDNTIGKAQIAFRGNAVDLYSALAAAYANPANSVALGLVDPITHLPHTNVAAVNGQNFNVVQEDVTSAYVLFAMKPTFLGHDANLQAGLRLERTDVNVMARQSIPTSLRWDANNDFTTVVGSSQASIQQSSNYSNLLPNLDFSVDLTDQMIARVSFSKTIARPGFGSMFVTTTVNTPSRPTYFGQGPSAAQGNAALKPLQSDNVDLSWEWYYGKNSYVSVGFYNKSVTNFLGSGTKTGSLFGLTDPSSGAAGSRSGAAVTALNGLGQGLNDDTLFTMTALIDQNGGNVAAATVAYQALLVGGVLTQANIDAVNGAQNITGNSSDPLYQFTINTQVNNHEAKIHGFELQGQHFFGDSGFGVSASYTTVSGDVSFDNAAPSTIDQFALLGLSNTYNVTLIYDKDKLSGRVSYNWRDAYLSATNRDGSNRNPTNVAPFGQLDATIDYQLTPQILITFEGLNLNKETYKTYARTTQQIYFVQELDTRYQVGLHYKF